MRLFKRRKTANGSKPPSWIPNTRLKKLRLRLLSLKRLEDLHRALIHANTGLKYETELVYVENVIARKKKFKKGVKRVWQVLTK